MTAHWSKPRDDRGERRWDSIAFFGLFGSGNTGNDGSLEAMLRFVRRARPEAHLMCICGHPEYVEREFGVRTVPIYADGPANPALRKAAYLLDAVRQLEGCQLLIVPGTGILDDFGTGPSGLPLALFTWCLAARLRRVRVAFVSIGAGPIHHPLSRRLMKSALGMSSYRSYRDQLSKNFLEEIGFRSGEDPVYPDLAFLLPEPPARPPGGSGEPIEVGVGVMTYRGWRNDPTEGAAIYAEYLKKMTEFVLWLLDGGRRVRFLMGDGTDQRAMDDMRRNVFARRPSLPAEWLHAEPSRTLHELMSQIAQTDIVVATRFHNIVCALKLARPALSIGYAEKNDVLMQDVGLGGFCQAIERLDPDRLVHQFMELEADLDAWHRKIVTARRRYRVSLEHQETLLADRLCWRRGDTDWPRSASDFSV